MLGLLTRRSFLALATSGLVLSARSKEPVRLGEAALFSWDDLVRRAKEMAQQPFVARPPVAPRTVAEIGAHPCPCRWGCPRGPLQQGCVPLSLWPPFRADARGGRVCRVPDP